MSWLLLLLLTAAVSGQVYVKTALFDNAEHVIQDVAVNTMDTINVGIVALRGTALTMDVTQAHLLIRAANGNYTMYTLDSTTATTKACSTQPACLVLSIPLDYIAPIAGASARVHAPVTVTTADDQAVTVSSDEATVGFACNGCSTWHARDNASASAAAVLIIVLVVIFVVLVAVAIVIGCSSPTQKC
jgi:hypothetical protein